MRTLWYYSALALDGDNTIIIIIIIIIRNSILPLQFTTSSYLSLAPRLSSTKVSSIRIGV